MNAITVLLGLTIAFKVLKKRNRNANLIDLNSTTVIRTPETKIGAEKDQPVS